MVDGTKLTQLGGASGSAPMNARGAEFDNSIRQAQFIKTQGNSGAVKDEFANRADNYFSTQNDFFGKYNADAMDAKFQKAIKGIRNPAIAKAYKENQEAMKLVSQQTIAKENFEGVATIFINVIKQIPKLLQLQ